MSLAELFGHRRKYRIPDYQRPYSWTTREAEQLLDDLAVALEESTDPGIEDGSYFMGAVLLMNGELPPFAARDLLTAAMTNGTFDIVDGQQRLITLSMLLAVLRDLVAEKGGSIASLVDPLIWSTTGDERSPRITLPGREGTFLRNHVQESGASEVMPEEDDLSGGEARMLAVREHIATYLIGDSAEELEALVHYLLGSCHFSVITTRTVDRAHRIFAVLNNRGRPLARNDILKAQLLGAIDPAKRPPHTEAWNRVEQRLGNDFENFFSHIRTIETRSRARIITGISDLVEQAGGVEPFFEHTFLPYAAIYEALQVRPITRPQDRAPAAGYLTYLGWLGSADWMPAAMLHWRQNNGDSVALESFLRRLDRLAYGLRLLGIGSDKRLARFNALTSAVRQRDTLDRPDSPLEFTRDELRNIQFNLRSLHARSQLTCKLVLLRINDVIAGYPQDLDPADYTVEHILPQKPGRNSDWRTWYPSADERERCMQSLGNLTLITRSQNDRARNMDLARKLEIYFADGRDGALHITRELDGVTQWQPAEIMAREEKLIGLIGKLWSLDLPGPGAANAALAGPEATSKPMPIRRTRSSKPA